MSVDRTIGLCGPDYLVPIEWGAIRQFAKSLYSSLPDWLDDPNAVIPPTFLVTAGYHWGYLLERPPAGSDIEKAGADHGLMMDGEQSFTFYGPPPKVGDVLTASTTIGDHFFKEGKSGGKLEFFVVHTDFRDKLGRVVAQWRPTSIRTERSAAQSFRVNSRTKKFYVQGEERTQLNRIKRICTTSDNPTPPGPITMPALTLTDMVRYQCASGEDSASHHDSLAAQNLGYPDAFSVGMHHAGVLGAYAAHWLGPKNVRAFRARFMDMIWPGDVLTYNGRVIAMSEGNEGPTLDILLECSREGVTVVRAWATFLMDFDSSIYA